MEVLPLQCLVTLVITLSRFRIRFQYRIRVRLDLCPPVIDLANQRQRTIQAMILRRTTSINCLIRILTVSLIE